MQSIIIVGGGINGLLSAYELHKSGHKVTLIDRQDFGQESSWAGGGIISPLFPWRYADPITDLALLSQQLYPQMLTQMQEVTGIDPEFIQSGMLMLGDYSKEAPEAWAQRFDINIQSVHSEGIRHLAPEVNSGFDNGLWMPHIHQVRNPRLIKLLVTYLKQATDVSLIENQPVNSLVFEQGKVTGVEAKDNSYRADQTLLTCGAWTAQLFDIESCYSHIKPIKGQMLLLKGDPELVKHITLSQDRYIIPRKDGHVLVGSTTEDVGFNKDTDQQVEESLQQYAIDTIPQLANFEIAHHWSGLRPGSKTGIPAIGAHPSIENLYINSGQYRNGLVMAPASAKLIGQIMLQKAPCLPEINYAPCDAFHNKN